jgi:hypothetical protein
VNQGIVVVNIGTQERARSIKGWQDATDRDWASNHIMTFNLTEILNYTVGNNSMKDYLVAIGVFVTAVAVLRVFRFSIIGGLRKLAARTKSELDELLRDHWQCWLAGLPLIVPLYRPSVHPST